MGGLESMEVLREKAAAASCAEELDRGSLDALPATNTHPAAHSESLNTPPISSRQIGARCHPVQHLGSSADR